MVTRVECCNSASSTKIEQVRNILVFKVVCILWNKGFCGTINLKWLEILLNRRRWRHVMDDAASEDMSELIDKGTVNISNITIKPLKTCQSSLRHVRVHCRSLEKHDWVLWRRHWIHRIFDMIFFTNWSMVCWTDKIFSITSIYWFQENKIRASGQYQRTAYGVH